MSTRETKQQHILQMAPDGNCVGGSWIKTGRRADNDDVIKWTVYISFNISLLVQKSLVYTVFFHIYRFIRVFTCFARMGFVFKGLLKILQWWFSV